MKEFWWHHLPISVSRFSPMLAVILTDGFYLTAWRKVSAFGPPLCLLLGFLIGWFHFAPGNTFTFAIWVMALMLAISSFGAGLGAWLWLGYSLGDFILFPHLQNSDWLNFNVWIYLRIPLILSYILLGILLVSIPLTSKGLRRLTLPGLEEKLPELTLTQRRIMTGIAAVIQAGLMAALVYVWTQAVPTLIRPVYTWQGNQPPVEAIQPLQTSGQILVVVAAILGIIRVVIEYESLNNPSVKRQPGVLQGVLTKKASLRPFPVLIAVPIKAAFSTFMLSGILTGWQDAIIVGVLLLLAMLLRESVLIRLDTRWINQICRVPLLLRIVVAFGINYFLAVKIVEVMWNSTSTFLPIVISTILSFVVFALLIPNAGSQKQKKAIALGGQP
ncbi:MAG: hypothetical protein KME49_08480 [Brasilonema octagenarum HA4186-MV1]|jgi:hypothetical protein|nr:hypothetical protein [Brasilonema octagenarum HA4186-MV1]